MVTGMCGVYLAAAELSCWGHVVTPMACNAKAAGLMAIDQVCKRAFPSDGIPAGIGEKRRDIERGKLTGFRGAWKQAFGVPEGVLGAATRPLGAAVQPGFGGPADGH
jgi:hypothetical protein